MEVITRVIIEVENLIPSCERRNGKIPPGWALAPVSKLGVCDKAVTIADEIDAQERTMCIPNDENANGCYSNIQPDNLWWVKIQVIDTSKQ